MEIKAAVLWQINRKQHALEWTVFVYQRLPLYCWLPLMTKGTKESMQH